MLSYKKLWQTMEEKGITAYALTTKYGFSRHTIYRLRHNMGISSGMINNLCTVLSCNVEDIMTYIPDEQADTENKPGS